MLLGTQFKQFEPAEKWKRWGHRVRGNPGKLEGVRYVRRDDDDDDDDERFGGKYYFGPKLYQERATLIQCCKIDFEAASFLDCCS